LRNVAARRRWRSKKQCAEIVRVLTEKFSWEQHRAKSALQTILARGIRVKIRGTVKVCRDPSDDMFLECTALAKADLLVAGDKDLLTLGAYKGTRIVTPSEYLRAG
jgi:putative PIN family toxin of toxin-antitoxin system